MSATLRQIAEEAGVSWRTVARVLNGGNKEVWPSAAKRADEIRQIAQRLGYRPNAAAKAISTGRFGTITLLMGLEAPSYLPGDLVLGIDQELAAREMHLSFARLPDERMLEQGTLPRMLRQWSCDGFLINYLHHFPPQLSRLIQRQGVPSVWMNVKLDADCVHLDDLQGAKDATEHLLKLGHRRIGYVSFNDFGHYSEADRLEGYHSVMRAAGLAPWVWTSSDWVNTTGGGDNRQEMAAAVLAKPDRPTALVTYNAAAAGPLICRALQKGLRVPEDLSIITFQAEAGSDTGMTLTAIRVAMDELGRTAAATLLEKIEHPRRRIKPRAIHMRLIAGTTCAAHRR